MRTLITSRDLLLLETIASYEILTTRRINSLMFPNVDRRTVLRRLRKIEKKKFIQKNHGLKLGEIAWTLDQYGAFRIGLNQRLESINRNSLEHDVTLSDIRMAMEGQGVSSKWVSEQHLSRTSAGKRAHDKDQIIPDAIFAGKTKTGFEAIALELELSGKNASRYERVLSCYGRKVYFFALWYVVSSEALGRRIERQWTKINPRVPRPKFGWVHLPDLLIDPAFAKVHMKDEVRLLGDVIAAQKAIISKPLKSLESAAV